MENTSEKNNKIIVFKNSKIRRKWYKNEWYYSIVDIISILTDSVNPTDYFKKIRKRDD